MDFLITLIAAGLLGLGLAIYGVRSGLKNNHPDDWLRSKRLSESGINLEVPRELEFWLFVRTEASARYVADQLTSDGYIARLEQGKAKFNVTPKSEGIEEEGFCIFARKVVTIYGGSLKQIRARLTPLAEKENGKYLGWKVTDDASTA